MHRLLLPLLVAAACLTFTASASAQATRTWVSGVGDDVNPCSRFAPCKTFAGAISKTAAGGEINALDPGGFGAVTITKAITIDVRGYTGGVANTSTHGVIVNAGATDDVVLRGLDIFGGPGAGCGYGGLSGVRVLRARSVRIQDTTIARQNRAIDIAPGADPVDVLVDRVDVHDNCAGGVAVAPTGAGKATVTLRDSTISNSGTAIAVADNGAAWLTGNLLFANALGLQATGTGVINDFGDNRLVGNAADGEATNDLTPQPPAGPTGETGATGAPGPAGPAGPQGEPAIKLLLAPAAERLTAKAGRSVMLRFATSAAAESAVTVRRSGKAVASVKRTVKAGANAVRVPTKGLGAGKYTLTLRATGADGQRASATIALKLRRR